MNFKSFYLCVTSSIIFLTLNQETFAATKYVGFTKEDCTVYRHYLDGENDKYIVRWNGEDIPRICTLRFKARGSNYRLCAKVETFKLDCTVSLQFYWGIKMNLQKYTCDNPVKKYCDDDGLVFMDIVKEGSTNYNFKSLVVEVSPTYMGSHSKESASSSSAGLGTILGGMFGGVAVLIILIICFAKFCSRNRNRDTLSGTLNEARYNNAARGNVTLTNPDQYRPLPVQDQNQSAGQPYPLAGQQYPLSGQQYPPSGQQYPPSGQQYPPSGQQYPPSGQQYPPSGQQYPPSGKQYPPSGQQYPPSGQQYPPSGQQYPSSGQQYPSAPPAPSAWQQYPSDQSAEAQNLNLGEASANNTPDMSDPPPSYSSVMGNT